MFLGFLGRAALRGAVRTVRRRAIGVGGRSTFQGTVYGVTLADRAVRRRDV
ncbi:hypothetical protein [Streptomyces sp. NPDC006285]|uniref:hypothetical protein n=1 Tax=Streptomyces sp. NPDC006285 TaxID=3364742 RepID=UPI00368D63F8